MDIAIFKAKGDAPIGLNSNRPMGLQVALERVQPKPRCVHVVNRFGLPEQGKNQPEFLGMNGLNAYQAPGSMELLKALVSEALDHGFNVTRRVTIGKSYVYQELYTPALALFLHPIKGGG